MADALVINGRYEVVETIGAGGMGVLYRARDPWIGGRTVALKLLRQEIDDEEVRQRFRQEASAAGILEHESIVRIFDVGEHEGHPFIAMEFVEGETLAALIRRNEPVPLRQRLLWAEQLCDALAFAHARGIVHRDIKPLNLMIERRRQLLKILDFGIAKVADSGLTSAGMMIGTVNYMSPEQMRGERIDHRSDIFSVGATIFELLTGQRAFPGTLADGVMGRILSQPTPSALAIAPHLPPQVDAILGRALEKDPARRYPDLTVMRDEIRALREAIELAEAAARGPQTPTGLPVAVPAGATPLPSGVTGVPPWTGAVSGSAPVPTGASPASAASGASPAASAALVSGAMAAAGASAAAAPGTSAGAPGSAPAGPAVAAVPAPAADAAAAVPGGRAGHRAGALAIVALVTVVALVAIAGLAWWLVPWDRVTGRGAPAAASAVPTASDAATTGSATPSDAPVARDAAAVPEAAAAAARLEPVDVAIDIQPWAEVRIVPTLREEDVAALPPEVVRELARERGPCTTPCRIGLPAGEYVLMFENAGLGLNHTERITVQGGEPATVRLTMPGFDVDRLVAELAGRRGGGR